MSEEGDDGFCRIRGCISTLKKNDLPVFAVTYESIRGRTFHPFCRSQDRMDSYM